MHIHDIAPWREDFENEEHIIINYIRDKYGYAPLDISIFKLFFKVVYPKRDHDARAANSKILQHDPTYDDLELGIFINESSDSNRKAYPNFEVEEFDFCELSDGTFDVYYKCDASRYDHSGLVLKSLSEKGKFAYCLNKFELSRYLSSCRFVRSHYGERRLAALAAKKPFPMPRPHTEFDLGFIIPGRPYPVDCYAYSEQGIKSKTRHPESIVPKCCDPPTQPLQGHYLYSLDPKDFTNPIPIPSHYFENHNAEFWKGVFKLHNITDNYKDYKPLASCGTLENRWYWFCLYHLKIVVETNELFKDKLPQKFYFGRHILSPQIFDVLPTFYSKPHPKHTWDKTCHILYTIANDKQQYSPKQKGIPIPNVKRPDVDLLPALTALVKIYDAGVLTPM